MARKPDPDKRPFEPGNTLALVHGADSTRFVTARAEDLQHALELTEVAPDLANPRYAETILRYYAAAARERILHDRLVELGESGKPINARLVEGINSATRLAHDLATRLGLDPASHAANAVLRVEAIEAEARVKLQDKQAEVVATMLHGLLTDLGVDVRDSGVLATVRRHLSLLDADDATDAQVVDA